MEQGTVVESDILQISVEQLLLRHGCIALLISGLVDREPYVPPKAGKTRRDPETSHEWMTCGCFQCQQRRDREVKEPSLQFDPPADTTGRL